MKYDVERNDQDELVITSPEDESVEFIFQSEEELDAKLTRLFREGGHTIMVAPDTYHVFKDVTLENTDITKAKKIYREIDCIVQNNSLEEYEKQAIWDAMRILEEIFQQ